MYVEGKDVLAWIFGVLSTGVVGLTLVWLIKVLIKAIFQ